MGFVARLFTVGWQPAEVVRQARREGGAIQAALAATAIVAHSSFVSAELIDPRWQRQIDELTSTSVGDARAGAGGWFADWSDHASLAPTDEMMAAFELLVTVRSLPPIEELIPPPGSHSTGKHSPLPGDLSTGDHELLERVRHLLDKAESTEFEAEAEAFTAKAHELITRHAIDVALLADGATSATDEQPVATRIDIDDPYADAKSLLLQIVAEANRCRTVYHERLAFSTALGFSGDLAATELLYTSLLVQAQSALAAAARSAPPGARTRSRSYRSAFLVAYANRIGQRLEQINEHLVDEAVGKGAVLPVLRSREATVADAFAARYPNMASTAVRGGHDPAGWAGGRQAADQAQLTFADLDDAAEDADAHAAEPAALAP